MPALILCASKAVQRFLAERQFEKVEVFSTDESPRNNLGGWPVRVIRPGHSRKDFDYYATKDRAMAAEATESGYYVAGSRVRRLAG
jgi:hypothetical protein